MGDQKIVRPSVARVKIDYKFRPYTPAEAATEEDAAEEAAALAKDAARIDDPEQTPNGTRQVCTYAKLLQAVAVSPKSIHMGDGQSPAFIGRQKYKTDQQQIKEKEAKRKRSAKLYDKISAIMIFYHNNSISRCSDSACQGIHGLTATPGHFLELVTLCFQQIH